MKSGQVRFRAILLAAVACTGTVGLPSVVHAQDSDARLRKIETEVRALQRKVFPGGDGRFFETNAASADASGSGLPPSTTAMTDVLARLDAIEAQLARITSQVELNTNALAKLTGRVAALEPVPPATPAPVAATPAAAPAVGTLQPAPPPPSSVAPAPTPAPVQAAPSISPAEKPAGPSAERLARVQAIAKPQTGDAGEDEYSYGYRLWEAKLYPEAQQQLRLYAEKYSSHARISYGRNLLGRAYLDDGKPRDAAAWFLKNYQEDKQGARAGDSLLYLAEAMIASKDSKRACIALAGFGETYPALATGRLKDQYEANRNRVTCN